ncbi:MAG: ZIP family metal transporter [Thaumarchaeota archaeon]|nr:ZIP family metal transporter [Nitrososphaerota archaeon]
MLLGLGAVAGFTIYLGLPVAAMKQVSARVKGFLNAITIGVLIFILIEVLPEAKQLTEDTIVSSGIGSGYIYVVALVAGMALGIFGLVAYEMQFIRLRKKRNGLQSSGIPPTGAKTISETSVSNVEPKGSATLTMQKESKPEFDFDESKRIALTIAIGIGVHNFSEGLAIGQSYVSDIVALSYLLIIGFAVHNATEGFGISAPMAGFRPSAAYLAALGFIGGFPTLLGTVVGAVWPPSNLALTFFLAVAAGALIYIISGMFYVARRQTSNQLFMLGLFLGFLVAYGTDLYLATLHV